MNGVNVVKVGHKQVVSLIRQGGNSLLMKVVSVTRKPESEETVRKKGKVLVHSQQNCFILHIKMQVMLTRLQLNILLKFSSYV